jgi:pyrimidine-specific ribonucleoside hydrolase
MEEWRAGVLTNEIHGHVGIYALIGMKMGILAKEYFSANGDDMHIRSFAGHKPPISCMNDGLQVSTGSSLGHGLIVVENTNEQNVAAIIDFKGNKRRFSLKEDFDIQIRNEIRFGVENYGLSSDQYWEHIRKLALSCWIDLDRNNIFMINDVS